MSFWRVAVIPGLVIFLGRGLEAGAESAPNPSGTGSVERSAGSHWAYQKPQARPLPAVQDPAWARNEIDHFVLARLDREGLRPAEEASRETLIRRVTLDLTGLPPTPDEVDAFLSDPRPDAYEQAVERLLNSPHYGERWARPWLDQARYADSNGYEADFRRSIWPYRDWVIRALNEDMPFDQFTVEQLAGDLVLNATRDQKIATGFHRNTMVNTEGGTDDEEFRIAALVDRVNTTFEVWMGTTFACAQCHNHKYDPFTQKEYYEVMAIFNQTKDRGRSNDPQMELANADQLALRAKVRAQIAPLEKVLETSTPELEVEQAAWERPFLEAFERLDRAWTVLEPVPRSGTGGVLLEVLGDRSVLSSGPLPGNSIYEIEVEPRATGITALRLEALVDGSLPHRSSGRSEEGDFVLTEFQAEVLTTAAGSTNVLAAPVAFEIVYANHAMGRYPAGDAIDGKEGTGWSIAAHEPENRRQHEVVFVAKQRIDCPPGAKLMIRLKQESVRTQHLLGRFRISMSEGPEEAHRTWGKLEAKVRRWLAVPVARRSDKEKKDLAAHYRSKAPSLEKTRQEIAELRKQEPHDIPTTLVLEAVEKPRETFVLVRGSHLNKGGAVNPGVPKVLHPFPTNEPLNRLTFARWLTHPDNPLVGRVTLNRIWAQYFGMGLVETSEEFGAQGEAPSHPELLDWLALEFVRQKWSMKAMHRLVVNSATYRQSSAVSAELAQRDPYNRLLARGPRFRMEAEMLRDQALAVSGLLDRRIGGPSVFPFQPQGIWNSPYNGDKWQTSTNGQQFRRGLYTFWRRTAPYASFMAFDAPSREVSCERRARSNTPVQALVTLNDPAFVAAANALARRIMAEGGATLRERLVFGFKCCAGRAPTAEELRLLEPLFTSTMERFQRAPADAEALATAAAGKPEGPALWADWAAWTVLANVLLNLDEALTKG